MSADPFAEERGREKLSAIEALFKRSGIDAEDIARVERVNLWQGFLKDADGEPQVVDLAGVSLVPRWAEGPEWPVVQPGPPVRLAAVKPRPATRARPVTVVWPDMQIGFWRDGDGQLVPTHDPAAIEVALEVTASIRPDVLVWLGDNLDLPEFGKYRQHPSFAFTTQAAVDFATTLAARARSLAGRGVWLAGNHEERLPNWIVDNGKATHGLRQGNAAPSSWPVLSVPHLCRLDETGWEYLPGYPANVHWVNDRLRIIHGNRATKGATATAYLNDERVSTIYGHVHRREWLERTRMTRSGPRTILAASPGCLARTDGVVPGTHSGHDLDGRPLTTIAEDWQQGICVVTAEEGDSPFDVEMVPIHDGRAFWRGKVYGERAA